MNDDNGALGSPGEPTSSGLTSKPLRIAVLAIFILLIIAILLPFRPGRRTQARADTALTALIAGDLQLKQSLALEGMGKAGQSKALASAAKKAYAEAVRAASSPGALRRLGILQATDDSADALRTFSGIASTERSKQASRAERLSFTREAQVWRRVYSKEPLAQCEAREYARFVRSLDVGPARYYALDRIYRSAGLTATADAEMKRARREFAADTGAVAIIFVLWGLGGVAGAVALLAMLVSPRATSKMLSLGRTCPSDVSLERVLSVAMAAYIVIAVSGSIVVGLILSLVSAKVAGPGSAGVRTVVGLLTYAGAGLGSLAVLVYLLRKAGAGLRDIGLKFARARSDIAWGFAGYVVALPLITISLRISDWLKTVLPQVPTPSNPVVPAIVSSPNTVVLVGLFLLVVGLAPFLEEVFFRGALFRALRSMFGVWPAILLSAAAFALVHPQLPLGFAPVFILGVVFAALAHARESLLPSIVAHALNNGTLFFFMVFAAR